MSSRTTERFASSHSAVVRIWLAGVIVALLFCCMLTQAAAVTINAATAGTANASSEGFGSIDDDANDGNRNGNFGAGSVWHTTNAAANHFWEVDLGSDQTLDNVLVFPRTGQGPYWTDYKIEVRNAANALVFSQSFLPGNSLDQGWGTNAVRGVVGQTVRIESNGTPLITSMAEFEVYTRTAAPFGPIDLMQNATITASAAGFGAAIGDGADGDIDGDFNNAGFPVYHSAAFGVGQFWRADFGALAAPTHVNVFSRTDDTTTGLVRLSILGKDLSEIYGVDLDLNSSSLNALTYRFEELIPAGTFGQYVQLSTLENNFLAFAEVEVFGIWAAPEPSTFMLAAFGLVGLAVRRRCNRS